MHMFYISINGKLKEVQMHFFGLYILSYNKKIINGKWREGKKKSKRVIQRWERTEITVEYP